MGVLKGQAEEGAVEVSRTERGRQWGVVAGEPVAEEVEGERGGVGFGVGVGVGFGIGVGVGVGTPPACYG